MVRESYVGAKLGIPEMDYGPVEENGVIFLFGILHKKLGFKSIQEVRKGYPDCKALKEVAPGKYKIVSIEFEYKSSDFVRHKHLDKFRKGEKCDYIVCWFDNWEDCPKEIKVISLRDFCNVVEEKAPEKIKHLIMKDIDTVVCPAKKKGFKKVFIRENKWWAIRILSSRLDKIKFLAMYQVAPISAITHIAQVTKIKQIKKGKDKGKYILYLKNKKKIKAIGLKLRPRKIGGLRGPIYTSKKILEKSKNLDDVVYG